MNARDDKQYYEADPAKQALPVPGQQQLPQPALDPQPAAPKGRLFGKWNPLSCLDGRDDDDKLKQQPPSDPAADSMTV